MRMDLVAKNIPKPTEAETEQALLKGIDREIKLGWCEIQNAGSELSDQEIIRRAYAVGKSETAHDTMPLTVPVKPPTHC